MQAGRTSSAVRVAGTSVAHLRPSGAGLRMRRMNEAVTWAKRCPNPMPGPSEIEIRPFYEAEDLAGFVAPEALATPRGGERGKLGVA